MSHIRTPSDLIGFLRVIAQRHPLVEQVIHGEDLRMEDSTKSKARYPQVDIDWPAHTFPVAQGPTRITTSIRVVDRSSDDTTLQDMAHHRTYHIARDLVALIMACAEDEDGIGWGFELPEQISMRPIAALSSDLLRGWEMELAVTIDRNHCLEHVPVDPDEVPHVAFAWANADTDPTSIHVTLTDQTILAGGTAGWVWAEVITQPEPTTTVPPGGIDLDPVAGQDSRQVDVWRWVLMPDGERYWAYARCDSRLSGGRSTPFPPYLPDLP